MCHVGTRFNSVENKSNAVGAFRTSAPSCCAVTCQRCRTSTVLEAKTKDKLILYTRHLI